MGGDNKLVCSMESDAWLVHGIDWKDCPSSCTDSRSHHWYRPLQYAYCQDNTDNMSKQLQRLMNSLEYLLEAEPLLQMTAYLLLELGHKNTKPQQEEVELIRCLDWDPQPFAQCEPQPQLLIIQKMMSDQDL